MIDRKKEKYVDAYYCVKADAFENGMLIDFQLILLAQK